MWVFVLAGINQFLGWVLRTVVLKFVVYTVLFFVISEFLGFITEKLPTALALNGAFSQISSNVWYFLDLFQISFGISAILSAYVLRFSIRRLPFIG